MLPGLDGDCLLLSYGSPVRRVLVDGGRAATYERIAPVLAALDPPGLDLLVVTHVDQDHVLGVLALFADPQRVPVREVWFNGFHHLNDGSIESFGPKDGELLTEALVAQGVPWNAAFGGRAIEVGRPQEPRDDGAVFTVVAPDRALLARLAPVWEKECQLQGMVRGEAPTPPAPQGFEAFGTGTGTVEGDAATAFKADTSRANGTSIAFLFEFEGVRILFTGDGDDRRIAASLRPLADAEGGRLRLDALKVAHHGSKGNLSADLLGLIDCPRYLISTNGDRHSHPDAVAVARILVHGGAEKELCFNYRGRAAPWDVEGLRTKHRYAVRAPAQDDDGFLSVVW